MALPKVAGDIMYLHQA